jgi:hypothetical protein
MGGIIARKRLKKTQKKEKPKNMLRVMICWLGIFVNFALFLAIALFDL